MVCIGRHVNTFWLGNLREDKYRYSIASFPNDSPGRTLSAYLIAKNQPLYVWGW